ncbi:serine hydrolase domain-containing protein [Streptomyces monticola]|uniref:Serine hydrolase domain-containing protein n=1 Tax=Streptomyces monticola TaxID=2666263 RepID=A0ABW2JLW2_9ACTN
MSTLDELSALIQERLPGLLAEHRVPAAAVAVYAHGEVADCAAGTLSGSTGVEATRDSLFQIGSITKVWTATLAMQLVDEGKLDLDDPVCRCLPEFAVADRDAARRITVRQLLCHTAGFEGDIFTDTGKGDDCVEKFVATLGDVPQLFAPGQMFSYNNAAYCVLGRIIEVLRDKPYDDCLREHLFTPLGLAHAANGPYEAILHRAAVGHLTPAPGADPQPAPVWALARSNAPAGSMLSTSARDLLAFARLHLDQGKGPDGAAVLSAGSAAAMQRRQVELPYLGILGDAWGLGWEIFDWDGRTVIGHDGGTIGQSAFLRVVPDRQVAVAVLTNGGSPLPLYTEIVGRVLRELADVTMPPLPAPGAGRERTAVDASRYVGAYSSCVADVVVTQDPEGRVWVERTPKGELAALMGAPEKTELVAMRGDTLLTATPKDGMYLPHAFVGDDGEGRALYVHTGRADRRVSA